MNIRVKGLLLSTVGVLLAGAGHAEAPQTIDSLTCTRSDGSTLKHNVYAYTIGSGHSSPRYVTIYFLGTVFSTYLIEEYFGSGFSSCTMAGIPGMIFSTVTVADVSSSGSGVDVNAGTLTEDGINQRYTEVTFAYRGLSINSSASTPQALDSKEEQAKSLAAFQARGLAIPKH